MATPFPPTPSVEHLVTIFRRISACNVLIPAFQRSFVWHEPQVLALMESVYQGFPIGSILLWRVDSGILKRSESEDVPFPKGKISYPADFVLDGLQRLSSLYGVFHYGLNTSNRKFDISFDLQTNRFVNNALADEDDESDLRLPLNALFSPRNLIGIQTELLKRPNGDALVEKVLTLQSRFQDYMIPLVTLSQRRPEDVVTIFERINSTGTKLSPVDFMRAITWSSRFDLNRQLTKLAEKLEGRGFEFDEDALVKALGLVFDLDPLPDVMLQLRDQTAQNLEQGMRAVLRTCMDVIAFMEEQLQIHSTDYLPYEGQFLVLFNVFRTNKKLDKDTSRRLASWFLSVSANETMQGRPDHYVARTIKRVTAAIKKGQLQVPPVRVDQTALLSRRMLKRGALTTAIISVMAQRGVRSLSDGSLIEPWQFMARYDTNMISPILPLDELNTNAKVELGSAKTVVNSVYFPVRYGSTTAKQAIESLAKKGDSDAVRTLESQLIPLDAAKDLAAGRYKQFFEKRAKYILSEMHEAISGA